ncbi:hypothetical protein DWB68_00305 [Galactobacter valiniphilus]|uniref:Uncharacterized protein n=1 Tax=Galactobacter valiniphilus TaxID=2676122 RepID=A0A399JM79_9MICC|nr:hypothetical protein DWB68_00305 [Galactobacter valiniphilus]
MNSSAVSLTSSPTVICWPTVAFSRVPSERQGTSHTTNSLAFPAVAVGHAASVTEAVPAALSASAPA